MPNAPPSTTRMAAPAPGSSGERLPGAGCHHDQEDQCHGPVFQRTEYWRAGTRWRGQFGKVLRFHLENGKAPTLTTGGTWSMARVGKVNGESSDERRGMGGGGRCGKSSDERSGMGSDGRSGMGSDVRSGRGSDGRSGRVSDERFVEV